MTLSLRDWQKNKARTLVGETVSKSLKAVDDAALAMSTATQGELKFISAYGGALRGLQAEIAKTRAKCTKGVHDRTAALLDEMAKEAQGAYAGAQDMQRDYNDFIKAFKAARDETIKALQAVQKSQLPGTLAQAHKIVAKGAEYAQHTGKTFTSDEIQAMIPVMLQARMVVEQMQKEQAKRPVQVEGARALPATPADLKHQLDEVARAIAKLQVPGGFYGAQWTKKFRALGLLV